MVQYQIAVVDPDLICAGAPIFHLLAAYFGPEETLLDVFLYFSSTLFKEVLPGANSEAIIARGLRLVSFFGIEVHARQMRRVDVRSFELLWNETCSGFNPLIDVTFHLHPKPRVEKVANGQTGALFNMFLSPVDRKMALQSQE